MNFQRLDGHFPLRAADGLMSMDWLLTVPEREEGDSGSRTRLPLHPTGVLAGRFAPCLACKSSRGWPAGSEHAELGDGSLLRRAAELATSLTSHLLRALPDGEMSTGVGLSFAAWPKRGTVRATELRSRSARHVL